MEHPRRRGRTESGGDRVGEPLEVVTFIIWARHLSRAPETRQKGTICNLLAAEAPRIFLRASWGLFRRLLATSPGIGQSFPLAVFQDECARRVRRHFLRQHRGILGEIGARGVEVWLTEST